MNLIATTVSVNSEKNTEQFDSTPQEDYTMGIQSHVDGPRVLTFTATIEFSVHGNLEPYWSMKKGDRDSALSFNLLNALNRFEI